MTAPTRGGADEIREQMARWLFGLSNPDRYWDEPWVDRTPVYADADALLSGPLAPLLADRETVRAGRKLAQDWKRYQVLPSDLANRLLHALDGTP